MAEGQICWLRDAAAAAVVVVVVVVILCGDVVAFRVFLLFVWLVLCTCVLVSGSGCFIKRRGVFGACRVTRLFDLLYLYHYYMILVSCMYGS